MVKPNRFKYGSIGVFSPSSPAINEFPRRFERSIQAMDKMGLKVKIANNSHLKDGYVTTDSKSRANDLHQLLNDNEVELIISASGGFNSNSLLRYLDFDLIKVSKKPIVGFSDFTAIQLAILKHSNLITFYGPSLLPNFGEFPAPNQFMIDNFFQVLTSTKPVHYPSSNSFSDEFLFWDKEDNREFNYKKDIGWNVINDGNCQGILIGGNLDTLLALTGTEYWPDFSDSILFIEEAFTTIPKFERSIEILRQNGTLSMINGLLIGKFFQSGPISNISKMYSIVKKIDELKGKPVIGEINFGHTSPTLTIPIGIGAEINSFNNFFKLTESPVQ